MERYRNKTPNKMSYKEKLDGFNRTEKYQQEIVFLMGLTYSSHRILDFGCGVGACALMLRACGYDTEGYDLIKHNPTFKYTIPNGKYNTIYLMHSIAHLESPLKTINFLKTHLAVNGQIIIITPNKDWISQRENTDYIPDSTVVQHFCQYKLEKLFKDAGMNIIQQGQFGSRLGQSNERIFLIATL